MNIDAVDGIASLREDGIGDSLARICCDLVEPLSTVIETLTSIVSLVTWLTRTPF